MAGVLLPGEAPNQASCLSAVQRRPIHRPLLGLAGSGSACLAGSWCQSWNGFNGLPGVHSLLYMRSTTQSLLGPKCLRKEASLLHLTADRQAGRMQEARKPMWCGARLCSPASGGYSVREAEFAVAVLAEENPNGFQWGMVLRMARCGTKRQRR